ncbi:c-type cytochrome [Serratia plymuthica]|uniref:C-type cytochrome n=1 Tax=Serratia plymuthica TaxID=82996 RepID=A0A2X4XDD9_SERPL|nr:cytochrome c [Serratia plymuthica]QPS21254.1 c-type cytochrome [Serratia plymuthica]QPS62863.1 c-type cytochrome [Serratia plymuthica]RKS64814.1 mono/diheme cytochrome c family protein [Serratia plymuthica]CAI2420554.1 Gluconate 2-dehydrogenase cytochrome c subunit precursor [Serratia plymuthica]SQI37845.1 Gluconate 2-dehydrogenase cytochrome c subunit precursor [Serratia plymuthica]
MKGFTPSLLALLMLSAGVAQAVDDAQRIQHGEYLARAGDCAACHTAPGGVPFAGGLKMTTPIGAIYSTNITPDKQTGIGEYSLQEFSDALRKGVARDGTRLYPAMPYPSFAKISDEDVRDLYLYFTHQVKPVAQQNKDSDIPWPLNMRWPLALWNLAFREDGSYRPDAKQSAEWNRGAYLVQGLGHCGTCHTPRGIGFQEKALTQSDSTYLSGGTLEGWHAANLRADPVDGLGNWRTEDITRFLKTGHNPQFAAFGSMVDVVQDSTQHLSDADLQAIAGYLQSLPGDSRQKLPQADAKTAKALFSGELSRPGAQTYLDNCAACHRSDGLGYRNTFPQLAHNPALLDEDPSSLISIIINGSHTPMTVSAPTGLTMPDFGWRLSDEQVAQVASFVRSSWGNQAPAVTAEQVREIRKNSAVKPTQQ